MTNERANRGGIQILLQDDVLLAVCKPAHLPTMGVVNRPTLLEVVRSHLGGVAFETTYLHVLNRLDAPVTGVVLFARTPEVARILTRQLQSGTVVKQYWALLESPPVPREADCKDWLRNDKRHRKVHIAAADDPDGKEARLSYTTRAQLNNAALVQVHLETGRKHQIRVMFAHRDRPILGDRKYGSTVAFPSGIALHARRIELQHPVGAQPLVITAPVPRSWHAWGDFPET